MYSPRQSQHILQHPTSAFLGSLWEDWKIGIVGHKPTFAGRYRPLRPIMIVASFRKKWYFPEIILTFSFLKIGF